MKKLLLIASLMVIGLSGCFVAPYRGHDDGARRDQDRGEDRDHRSDQGDHDGGQGGGQGDHGGYR